LDENDNAPEINLPTSCVLITEYHELHESIASIVGKDADDAATPNGRLEMAITQGNREGKDSALTTSFLLQLKLSPSNL